MDKTTANALLAELMAGRMPDARGRFGPFGGRYVPETLMPALDRLEPAVRILPSQEFQRELGASCATGSGRPTALTPRAALGRWGAEVWLKREDLAHTGAHKINNALGQALLAKRSAPSASSPRPAPASTASRRRGLRARRPALHGLHGRGRHGAPGAERRPHALLGAEVVPVTGGDRTLRAAIDEACATGSPIPTAPSTAGLGGRARIPIRIWCASCSRSSAARRARRS
jgi:tryptophan synthase beta chain